MKEVTISLWDWENFMQELVLEKKKKTEINEDCPHENKERFLLQACYSKGVSYHLLHLSETQKQAEEWEATQQRKEKPPGP